MFIERSAGRIRLARTAFLIGGLMPCLLLTAWALQRGSAAHRDAVRASWQAAIGLPLDVAAIAHPRPGVIAATGVVVRSPAGRTVLELPRVEVESAATEERLVIHGGRVDAAAAEVLGGLAREWLRGHARHPRNCVIDARDVVCGGAGPTAERPERLRIECVAHAATRAIRLVRDGGDDIRIVRTLEGAGPSGEERYEVDGHLARPWPAALVAAVMGLADGVAGQLPAEATIVGDLRATAGQAGWSGSASGSIEGLDLGRCCAAFRGTASGVASVVVQRLAWRDGRLMDVAAACDCGPGWVDAGFFDRLVIALGCRPGPAAQPSATTQSFDRASCTLELDGNRLVVRPGSVANGLAIARGETLLQPPNGPVAFERLAWMISPPAASFVPAAGPGAWLMSIVPAASQGQPRADNPSGREGPRGF
jgi:hypothetical protein